jgi:3-oxoacyl-[acyl-carrier protein] reductase
MKPFALITGGSRGIGAATVRAFYRAGYDVMFSYLRASEQAEALKIQLPGVALMQADVSREDEVERLVAQAVRMFKTPDALVCNAGIAQQGLLTDLSVADWDNLFAVNVRGTFLCCRAVLPHMIRRGRGAIVTVSSIWGMTGASCEAAYSASKAAVIGLTRALAKEVGPSGIRVNCVAPGVISTDMNAALDAPSLGALCDDTPLGCIGGPQDAAEAVLYLASERAAFVTGQVLSPNGGLVI